MKQMLLAIFIFVVASSAFAVECRDARNAAGLPHRAATGYPDSQVDLDVDGDGCKEFCRIIGDRGSMHLVCTKNTSLAVKEKVQAFHSFDAGYPHSRKWVDIDGDGKMDFCTVIGNNDGLGNVQCLMQTDSGFEIKLTPNLSIGLQEAQDGADGFKSPHYLVDRRPIEYCRYLGNWKNHLSYIGCVPLKFEANDLVLGEENRSRTLASCMCWGRSFTALTACGRVACERLCKQTYGQGGTCAAGTGVGDCECRQ